MSRTRPSDPAPPGAARLTCRAASETASRAAGSAAPVLRRRMAAPGLGVRSLRLGVVALACALAAVRLGALTMSDLLNDPKMTPKRFAGLFENFTFVLQPFEVQNPDQFLATQCGDCIDYAVLADYVLHRRGYGTRLIRVEMVGKNVGHAVCYVTESRAYLDYNNRKFMFNLERSGPTIREIAAKVADSFEANWTFAQEFTFDGYTQYRRHTVFTVVKTDPPATDPDLEHSRAPHAKSPS